jgi:DNA-binding response OmpR family regulator
MPSRVILIVEDDAELLELLKSTFTDGGYVACGARLLIEAQRSVAELRFDLIIVDMSLPDGTGIDFITWLQSLSAAQGRHTPCLAITGHKSFGIAAVAAGFRATVIKPVDVRALLKIADDVLWKSEPPPLQP